MTSYILVLHAPAWSHQSVSTLVDFADVAVAAGKQLKAVFLYQDAVLNAQPQLDVPSDELNGQHLLLSLSKRHDVPLMLCVTAAEKRGINAELIQSGFQIAGLAEFAEMSIHTDKLIQFN